MQAHNSLDDEKQQTEDSLSIQRQTCLHSVMMN